jgi:hypothetical protein
MVCNVPQRHGGDSQVWEGLLRQLLRAVSRPEDPECGKVVGEGGLKELQAFD